VVQRLTLIAVFAIIAGCGAVPAKTELDFCLLARPIYWSRSQDMLTPETKKAIVDYNDQGAKLCGWKPINSPKGKSK